jgi:hypothetical protein
VQLHPSFTLLEALITNGSVLHLILNDDPYRGRPLYVRVKDGSDEEGRIRMITCGADFYVADVKEDLSYFNGIFFYFYFYFSCGVGADFYVADVKEDLSYFNGIFFIFLFFMRRGRRLLRGGRQGGSFELQWYLFFLFYLFLFFMRRGRRLLHGGRQGGSFVLQW